MFKKLATQILSDVALSIPPARLQSGHSPGSFQPHALVLWGASRPLVSLASNLPRPISRAHNDFRERFDLPRQILRAATIVKARSRSKIIRTPKDST
jgi:hypothetical protein